MAYFKIGDKDFSNRVSSLKIQKKAVYNVQTNARGDSVVDYINSKRTIEVGIIPMSDAEMLELQLAIAPFGVAISFLNPETNSLEENLSCIIPDNDVEYYTIQAAHTSLKATKLKFTEL